MFLLHNLGLISKLFFVNFTIVPLFLIKSCFSSFIRNLKGFCYTPTSLLWRAVLRTSNRNLDNMLNTDIVSEINAVDKLENC
jgi:hypothetical protein